MLPTSGLKVIRASELVQDYLTTGSKLLDDFLYGGIPTFGITEIVGEASTGKTQFCLQLSLMAQLPKSEGGLDSGAIYISTEQLFPSKRLIEMSEHFTVKYQNVITLPPMDNILVDHVSDIESLMNYFEVKIPKLISEKKFQKPPRLIILDSIAALFRSEYDRNELQKRTQDLRTVATSLHDVGRAYDAAIVVVNQVTGSFADEQGNVPSLGLAWKNLVTTRILLSREGPIVVAAEEEEMIEDSSGCKRTLSIKFAPHIPNGTIPIRLDAEGIKGSAPRFLQLDDT